MLDLNITEMMPKNKIEKYDKILRSTKFNGPPAGISRREFDTAMDDYYTRLRYAKEFWLKEQSNNKNK